MGLHHIRRMRRFLLAALLLLFPAAHAAPTAEMFDRLREAPSAGEAEDVAADIWSTWLVSGSATVDVLMERGIGAVQAGDSETARELFDRAILLKPDYSEAFHQRAAIFLAEENYGEALRDINETLTLEPRHFGAWFGLAMIMESFGSEKAALEAYREALKIYPLLPEAVEAERRLSRKAEGQDL